MRDEEENKDKKGWPLLMPKPNDWHHTVKEVISALGLILVLILILGILFLLTDIISLYFSPDIENRFSNLRTSLFILAALIGAPFLVWRTLIAKQQTNIAEHQAETARDRAYTELFTKAIEQLGAEKPKKEEVLDEKGKNVLDNSGQPQMREIYVPNIEVRIGAIYALERIMKDSEKDAVSVLDTLCAYVRENCGRPTEQDLLVELLAKLKGMPSIDREDIKTALTVIGRRHNWRNNIKKPDLQYVNFQGWNLNNFDLSYCNLSGAHMQGANMTSTKMEGADLSFAQMQGANMSLAQMQRADVSFAKMQRVNLSGANMQRADMSYAKMQEAKLYDNFLMERADMSLADMQYANIDEVQITSARKTAASVISVDFTKAKYDFDELQAQLPEMFGHKTHTKLPEGMAIPKHWSKADIPTHEGHQQYNREWADFKKLKGVE